MNTLYNLVAAFGWLRARFSKIPSRIGRIGRDEFIPSDGI